MECPHLCVWERERERERESVCVCVCVCERERERERECVCVCARERVCVCVCERERERERESVCVCVCVELCCCWAEWWVFELFSIEQMWRVFCVSLTGGVSGGCCLTRTVHAGQKGLVDPSQFARAKHSIQVACQNLVDPACTQSQVTAWLFPG